MSCVELISITYSVKTFKYLPFLGIHLDNYIFVLFQKICILKDIFFIKFSIQMSSILIFLLYGGIFLHVIQFIHFKYIIQCSLVNLPSCGTYHKSVLETFIAAIKSPCPFTVNPHSHLYSININLLSLYFCLFYTFSINRNIQSVVSFIWFLSLSISSRFIYLVARVNVPFLFVAE